MSNAKKNKPPVIEKTVSVILPTQAVDDLQKIAAFNGRSKGAQIRQWVLPAIERSLAEIRDAVTANR